METTQRNLSGIWSMVFGILALLCQGLNPLFTLTGLILMAVSIITHHKMTKSALAGLITSALAFLAGLIWAFVFIVIGGVTFWSLIQ